MSEQERVAAVEEWARREAEWNMRQRIDFLVGNAPPTPVWFRPEHPPKPAPCWNEDAHRVANRPPSNQAAIDAWEVGLRRERDLQWPLWWALEQIKRIDKPRPTKIGIELVDEYHGFKHLPMLSDDERDLLAKLHRWMSDPPLALEDVFTTKGKIDLRHLIGRLKGSADAAAKPRRGSLRMVTGDVRTAKHCSHGVSLSEPCMRCGD